VALAACLALPAQVRAGECDDPVFVQYTARIAERPTVAEQIEGWQEFLAIYPDNACRSEAEAILERLRKSAGHRAERDEAERWRERARGGIIAPGQDIFPPVLLSADAVPRNRLRLSNALVFGADPLAARAGIQSPLYLSLLSLEAAPVYNLGLALRLPMLVGGLSEEGVSFDVGNIILAVRGNWGRKLAGEDLPLVISAGITWGSGSSVWSPAGRATALDYAAYACPPLFHAYRYDQTDYGVHAEARLGVGRHFFSLGLAYHVLAQGEPPAFRAYPRVDPVFQMFRVDVGWQWQALDWLVPAFELNTGLGFPRESNTSHLYLTPGATLLAGDFSLALAVHVPLLQVADYTSAMLSLDLAWRLW